MALETGCKNKKITVVFIYMGFFSRENPCSVTGAVTGAKRGVHPRRKHFLGRHSIFWACEDDLRAVVGRFVGSGLRIAAGAAVRWVCCGVLGI